MNCPACGAAVADGARFCAECGQRLAAAPDERRLVTVLMADLVGFTAMSASNDPEQMKRLVDDTFERLLADITAFGGRLDKIVGDELVAQFGAPIAHEDDAERGVRAALRMQETLAGLQPQFGVSVQMRVGVNTGEAVVGSMRAGGDPTVMGDVVNTGQRLEKLAAPGEVIVGPATYLATRDAIEYDALGPQGLRGRDEPVDAYRALTALTRPGRRRAHGDSPFLGRDAELGALAHVLGMAATRRRAQFVSLSGDAGVGKSRLAAEIGARANREHGAVVLVGQCMPYGDSNVFGPIAEALRHTFGLDAEGGSTELVSSRVSTVLGLPPEAAETTRVVEGLVFLTEGVSRPGVDPTRARDDALRSTLAFLEGLAAAGPIVLTLSDVQWASDEVLELCDRMLARLHNMPFVLLTTTRPGSESYWVPEPGRHNSLSLHLEPLDDASTAELVRSLMCGEGDDATVSFLLERSGGNPFFVEELVAFVHETREGEHVRELPATLHGLVAARLDALNPDERSVLEDCAVVGGSGSLSSVLALAARPDARRLLESLAARDLLILDRDEFHFKSELIREIAYGTLTKAERARRHAVLAPVLTTRGEPTVDQAAHHLATAAELVEEIGPVAGVPADVREEAVTTLMRAAERDESVESWLAAERHHDRALGLLDPGNTPERRQALLGRARARVQRRVVDAARDDTEAALVLARDAGDRSCEALALTLLGEGEAAVGAYDAAEESFGHALDIWRELDDESGAANVLRGLGMVQLFRGALPEAERFVSEALGSFRSAGNQRGAAWALQNLAWIAFSNGNVPLTEKRLEESADLFGELGDWGGLGWAYGLLAFVRYNQGRLDEAAAIAEHIAIEGRETGNRWAVGMMDVLLAQVALWTGRTRECIERGNQAIGLFQEIGDRWGECMATGSVVRAYAELGDDDRYNASIERFRYVSSQMPDEGMQSFPDIIAACVELQRGSPERAQRALRPVGDADPNELGGADLVGAVGLAQLQLGDAAAAIESMAGPFEASADDGPRQMLGSRLALAYAVAQRPHDACEVIDDLRTRSGGSYADRIFALWAEGFTQVQLGDVDSARGSVDAAYAIAAATDARLEHAIAALARAQFATALDDDDAAELRDDARRQLDALGLNADGWSRVFAEALSGLPAHEHG
jgi:class 3 adenylate cyclase/tetratricopeptide (TPR) repeat protein